MAPGDPTNRDDGPKDGPKDGPEDGAESAGAETHEGAEVQEFGGDQGFGARLARARARQAAQDRRPSEADSDGDSLPMGGWGLALRLGVDLVAGLAVGVFIGLVLDEWLGTGPWLMILFFFLGAGAGMLNVYRLVSGVDYDMTYRRQRAAPEKEAPGGTAKTGRTDRTDETSGTGRTDETRK